MNKMYTGEATNQLLILANDNGIWVGDIEIEKNFSKDGNWNIMPYLYKDTQCNYFKAKYPNRFLYLSMGHYIYKIILCNTEASPFVYDWGGLAVVDLSPYRIYIQNMTMILSLH